MRLFALIALGAGLTLNGLVTGPAFAQMDSREGIALQNQILQLRQELDQLRQSGGGGRGGSSLPPPTPRGGQAAAIGGSQEIVAGMLDRVGQLEEETRRLRGRAEELDYQNTQLRQQMEKMQGDIDYRLQQVEGGKPGGAPAATPAPAPGRPAAPPVPPGAPPAPLAAPRPPERALSDGNAALQRRDYAAAEAAAREVIATRSAPRAQDAQLLLGQSLMGKRDFQNAAIAFDDAYRRNRQSARAPEAMVGLANAFLGFGAKREACATLGDLRSEFPRLQGGVSDQAADARKRGGC